MREHKIHQSEETKRKRRVIGGAALARDPALLAFASRGPKDGTFVERRTQRRDSN